MKKIIILIHIIFSINLYSLGQEGFKTGSYILNLDTTTKIINWENVNEGIRVKYSVKIKNTFNYPIFLTGIETECIGCAAYYHTYQIDPDSNYIVEIVQGTENKSDSIKSTIRITLTDSSGIILNNVNSVIHFNGYIKKGIPSLPNLPCLCRDWFSSNMFIPLLSKEVSSSTIKKWQFDFHAPIGEYVDHLFGNPYQFQGNYQRNKTSGNIKESYTFSLYSYHLIDLFIPDKNGLRLIINPCKDKSVFSKFEVSALFNSNNKESLKLQLFTRTLALQFDNKLLKQLHEEDTLASSNVPCTVLFTAKRIEYSKADELKIIQPSLICRNKAEIGETGMILSFTKMIPDLSPNNNLLEIRMTYSKDSSIYGSERLALNGVNENEIKHFTGMYLNEAWVSIPFPKFHNNKINFEGVDLLVSNDFIIGTIRIPANKKSETSYDIGRYAKDNVSIKDLQAALSRFTSYHIFYDPERSYLKVHIFYRKQK